jgi:hypothetical protein
MNLNINLSFSPEDLKKLLPYLAKSQAYIFGILLIIAFGYTAYVVNAALNVGPSSVSPLPSQAAKINFDIKADQETIQSLKSLSTVQSNISTNNLGTSNPF